MRILRTPPTTTYLHSSLTSLPCQWRLLTIINTWSLVPRPNNKSYNHVSMLFISSLSLHTMLRRFENCFAMWVVGLPEPNFPVTTTELLLAELHAPYLMFAGANHCWQPKHSPVWATDLDRQNRSSTGHLGSWATNNTALPSGHWSQHRVSPPDNLSLHTWEHAKWVLRLKRKYF